MSLKDITSNLRAPINTRVADKPTVRRPKQPGLLFCGAGTTAVVQLRLQEGQHAWLLRGWTSASSASPWLCPNSGKSCAALWMGCAHTPSIGTPPCLQVKVHSSEWRKVMAGEPVEINPSVRAK